MKVTLLGTGSPLPSATCAGPSTLVQAGGQNILVDAGRAVVMRLAGAMCPPPLVGAVLLTHLHSDHICDLNDVVTTRWVASPAATPLDIWGPVGTKAMVEGLFAMLAADVTYRLDHHDDLRAGIGMAVNVVEVEPGDSFRIGEVSVSVHRTDHRPVAPTIGFRIEADGKSAALAGDTVPCAELDEMCRGADLYVQTVVREDLVRTFAPLVPIGDRFLDILDYHSTVEQAAQTASRAGVGTLVLTHYVPAIQPGGEDEWRALAAAHFSGPIIVGPDLTSVSA
ncbi:MAG: MBL fold metallo-hydrolase [Actinobacteria bacterium]|nr:MBL fold metallo-hydrolase [Actinomycetota bacterium]